MTQEVDTALTPEVQAMIGVTGDLVECWGVVDKEYLRRFTRALMDPDPRYWDEEVARGTRYSEIIVPPVMVGYMSNRQPPSGVMVGGGLPPIPTNLKRVLEAGSEIEIYKYPSIGDKIYFQSRYSDIIGSVGRYGDPLLIVTRETTFSNQARETLCTVRTSTIRR